MKCAKTLRYLVLTHFIHNCLFRIPSISIQLPTGIVKLRFFSWLRSENTACKYPAVHIYISLPLTGMVYTCTCLCIWSYCVCNTFTSVYTPPLGCDKYSWYCNSPYTHSIHSIFLANITNFNEFASQHLCVYCINIFPNRVSLKHMWYVTINRVGAFWISKLVSKMSRNEIFNCSFSPTKRQQHSYWAKWCDIRYIMFW